MSEEGESEQKHVIFTGRNPKYIAYDLRKRIHWGHSLIIEQTGFPFLSGNGSDPSGTQKHQVKTLQCKKESKCIAGSVYWRVFSLYPFFGLGVYTKFSFGSLKECC